MTMPSRASSPPVSARKRRPKQAHVPANASQDLVSQLKRERIVSAAIDLFYAQGFARTTLDEVAKALGMTKPFIYQYFASKNALLAEICSRAINDAHETLNRTLPQQGTSTEKMRIIVREFTLSVINNQANAIIYSREETELAPQDRQKIIHLRRDFDRRLVALIEEGIARGEFASPDVRLTSLIIGSIVGWSPVWFRAGGRLTREQAAAGVADHVLRMLGARGV